MKYLLIIGLCLALIFASHAAEESKSTYWHTQRKGANYFNKTPTEDWFIAAKDSGIQFARFAADKWQSEHRDFLLGDADAFRHISRSDFELLRTTLDQAHQHDIQIVMTMLSLPGSRWKQNNQDQDDLRIWQNKDDRDKAIGFWKELAFLLRDHPAIVGYNILNEPHPEVLFGFKDFREIDFKGWYESVKGSYADLNLFYSDMVNAIRQVDPVTPIILDTGLYATPWAIHYLTPMQDESVIYSFHMYEPYAYTTKKINQERYHYPGFVPVLLEDIEQHNRSSHALFWDKDHLEEFLQPVTDWQKKFQIPSTQILVGEFGCDRTSKGAEKYLDHLIQIFDTHQWHWAFYSFREDCWDSMDYELGTGKLSWKYWDAVEQGNNLNPFRNDPLIFDVIKNKL